MPNGVGKTRDECKGTRYRSTNSTIGFYNQMAFSLTSRFCFVAEAARESIAVERQRRWLLLTGSVFTIVIFWVDDFNSLRGM